VTDPTTTLPVPVSPSDIGPGDLAEHVAVLAEQATAWLREATDIASVREVKARAAAISVYTRQVAAGRQAEQDAATIVRWAERRMGQLLDEQRQRGERQRGGDQRSETARSKTASEPLIGKPEREAADAMAQGTDEEFAEALDQAREDGRVSRGAVKRNLSPDPVNEAEAEARRARTRMEGEVLTLARAVERVAALGDAPMSLALLQANALVPDDLARLQLDAWQVDASAAIAVLDRWRDQLTRAQEAIR
jgi:hypothetical protein